MMSDLNMSHENISDFVSFPFFELTVVNRDKRDKRDMVLDLKILMEKCLILLHFHCLGSL